MMAHRDPRAVTVLARAREKFRALGDRGGEAMSELNEGWVASFLGSAQQALEITRRHHLTTGGVADGGPEAPPGLPRKTDTPRPRTKSLNTTSG
jgi:hypothetical protein